jgi:tetratricopeptide (TPR) repeat protein
VKRIRGAWTALSLALAACGAPRSFDADPGPYDRVPSSWLEPLSAARLAFDRGDAHAAYALVAPLADARPQVLAVRVFQQELELQLLAGGERSGAPSGSDPEAVRAGLLQAYAERAARAGRAEEHVLAARLETDPDAALARLAAGEVLDPRCPWLHYGRAWWLNGMKRYKEARESVRAALRLDPGHLPTLRLHATMLAGGGDTREAAVVLEVWLARTAGDPLFAAAERADALLDLAALRVVLGQPKEALELLAELDPRAIRGPVRAEEVRAAAHEARGELGPALEAARRASELRPDALLPRVQRAMILRTAGDTEGERKTWLRLLQLTEEAESVPDADPAHIDFEAALFRLQAHARLERLAEAQP